MKDTASFRADFRLAALCAVWVLTVAGGSAYLMDYGGAAGPQEAAPESWPQDSAVRHEAGTAHAVMFIHPGCPCTHASLRQLETAVVQGGGNVRVTVVVFDAPDQGEQWTRTPLVNRAAAISSARVVLDPKGREARRFGAMTSGHLVLYSAADRLLFSGGITPGRGHEGPCAGLEAVVSRLRDPDKGCARVTVFGCPIFSASAECQEGDRPCQCSKS